MIRTFELWWLSLEMIRKRQSLRRHPDHVEDATRFDVTLRLRIPLRQHDHSLARVFTLRRKEPRTRDIVLGRRRMHSACPGKLIGFEMIIGDRRRRVELFTCRHHPRRVITKRSEE